MPDKNKSWDDFFSEPGLKDFMQDGRGQKASKISETKEKMVTKLYEERFNGTLGSLPKSEPYKEGFLYGLKSYFMSEKLKNRPYEEGTAEMDAYHSGYEDAHRRIEYFDSVEMMRTDLLL